MENETSKPRCQHCIYSGQYFGEVDGLECRLTGTFSLSWDEDHDCIKFFSTTDAIMMIEANRYTK